MYDVMIIGGGIAGLQAAIQLGRYHHKIVVIDAGYGRSTLCHSYHNILGYPDGISGQQLRSLGRKQAEQLGIEFVDGEVTSIQQGESGFVAQVSDDKQFKARRVLLATGVLDRIPSFPDLLPCLGLTVYVCPDCDGYEVRKRKTLVLGAGNAGANMALELTYWTKLIIYINHEQTPVSEQLMGELKQANIEIISLPITHILTQNSWKFKGVQLHDGRTVDGERAFVAFGGNEVKSKLASQLGVKRLENKHILTDPRTKQTNVPHVWAAGDVVAHSEQVTIAMGEGSQAAIWIHKSLLQEDHIIF